MVIKTSDKNQGRGKEDGVRYGVVGREPRNENDMSEVPTKYFQIIIGLARPIVIRKRYYKHPEFLLGASVLEI